MPIINCGGEKIELKTINNQSIEGTGNISVQPVGDYATNTALENGLGTKQATLVSGTNIKTINNESILGSGNITVSGDIDLKTINSTSLKGTGDISLQVPLSSTTITVPASGGTITVNGMTSTAKVWVSPVPISYDVYVNAGCVCTTQATDSLTFTVSKTASTSMSVNVIWFG